MRSILPPVNPGNLFESLAFERDNGALVGVGGGSGRTLNADVTLGRSIGTFVPDAIDRSEMTLEGFVTSDPAMKVFLEKLKKLAATDLPFVLAGETGVGKGVYANAVHRASTRCEADFGYIDCAGLPKTLIESELFGHAEGSYTGATKKRVGLLMEADSSTAFLDEITEMPLESQGKFLRFLNERTVKAVGENSYQEVDVRIIAATNRDLGQAVRDGVLREDLQYRLGIVVKVPALRERPNDLKHMIRESLEHYAQELDCPLPVLSQDAIRVLHEYQWPGNVRQFCAVMQAVVLFSERGAPLSASDVSAFLGPETQGEPEGVQPKASTVAPDSQSTQRYSDDIQTELPDSAQWALAMPCLSGDITMKSNLDWLKKKLAMMVLQENQGNQSATAEQLGITRGSLRNIVGPASEIRIRIDE